MISVCRQKTQRDLFVCKDCSSIEYSLQLSVTHLHRHTILFNSYSPFSFPTFVPKTSNLVGLFRAKPASPTLVQKTDTFSQRKQKPMTTATETAITGHHHVPGSKSSSSCGRTCCSCSMQCDFIEKGWERQVYASQSTIMNPKTVR